MLGKIIHTYWTRLLATALVFVSVALASRYLGAEGKGVTSLIATNILLINLLNEMVGGVALIYLIPRRQPVALLVPTVLFTLINSCLLTAVFHRMHVIPAEYSVHLCFLSVLQSLGNAVLYVLLGREKLNAHNYLFLLKALAHAAFLALFFVVLKNQTVEAFLYALYISYALPLLLGGALLAPFLKKRPRFENIFEITKELFAYSSRAQLANLVQTLNYRLSFYLIAIFIGNGAVGIYSVALALGDAVWMMSKSIGMAQLTRIANTDDAPLAHALTKKFLRFSVLGALVVLLPALLAPESAYTLLFGNEFGEAKRALLMMAGGILVFSINIILANHFAGTGRYQINLLASLFGLIVNAGANLLLIPKLGMAGAGIAASLTYAVITFYTWTRFVKESPLHWKDLVVKKEDVKRLMALVGMTSYE